MILVDEKGNAMKGAFCRCGKQFVPDVGTMCPKCSAKKVQAILKVMEANGEASPQIFRAHWSVNPAEGRRRRESGPFSPLTGEHDSRIDKEKTQHD